MKFEYAREYPCGLKTSVKVDSFISFFFGGNLHWDDSETCPLHGKDCKGEK